MPVHHVHVNRGRASFFYRFDFLPEDGKIRGQNGRSNLDRETVLHFIRNCSTPNSLPPLKPSFTAPPEARPNPLARRALRAAEVATSLYRTAFRSAAVP